MKHAGPLANARPKNDAVPAEALAPEAKPQMETYVPAANEIAVELEKPITRLPHAELETRAEAYAVPVPFTKTHVLMELNPAEKLNWSEYVKM
jgi:hypothetical protein